MVGSICSALRRASAAASSGAFLASRKGSSEGSICVVVTSTRLKHDQAGEVGDIVKTDSPESTL